MNRESLRMFKHLLEVPVPATEAQCLDATRDIRPRSPMHASKIPAKKWRKALALYLEARLRGELRYYTHSIYCQTMELGHGAMKRLKDDFDTLSDSQCRVLHRAIVRAHRPNPFPPLALPHPHLHPQK